MKAHLLDSDEPLIAGQDQVAKCGQKVSKATFVFFFDGDESTLPISSLLCCRRCAILTEERILARYIYGLIDGEKAKHLEAEL